MTQGLTNLLFAATAGLTLSGIVANIYRMAADKPQSPPAKAAYYAVMIFAGPSVLFENATRSVRAKNCTRLAYGVALAIAIYWALMLGLLMFKASNAL